PANRQPVCALVIHGASQSGISGPEGIGDLAGGICSSILASHRKGCRLELREFDRLAYHIEGVSEFRGRCNAGDQSIIRMPDDVEASADAVYGSIHQFGRLI